MLCNSPLRPSFSTNYGNPLGTSTFQIIFHRLQKHRPNNPAVIIIHVQESFLAFIKNSNVFHTCPHFASFRKTRAVTANDETLRFMRPHVMVLIINYEFIYTGRQRILNDNRLAVDEERHEGKATFRASHENSEGVRSGRFRNQKRDADLYAFFWLGSHRNRFMTSFLV